MPFKKSTVEELIRLYEERAGRFEGQAGQLRRRYNRYSMVRLAVFVIAVGAAVWCFGLHWLAGALFCLSFVAVFYRFVMWHQRILDSARHLERLDRINRWERAALEHGYEAFHPGAAWIDPGHPYALDLDLFGAHSLFQYLNRGTTSGGRQRLAAWLQAPASPEQIRERQQAVAELAGALDWRQHLQALGLDTEDHLSDLRALEQWLSEPDLVQGNPWLRAAIIAAPPLALAGLLLWIFLLPWQAALLFLLPQALIIGRTARRVHAIHEKTARAADTLSHYSRLISHIEQAEFHTPRLRQLSSFFQAKGRPASRRVRRLAYIISQLNLRYNIFSFFINYPFLWDLQWICQLEKWKARGRSELPAWFDALAEIEALSSLANLRHNNPGWSFPEITAEETLHAEALGHPLLPVRHRVCNDLAMPLRGHIKLITGSNMAGKSTFLRTVGINIVLALAGAPVCAGSFRLPLLRVFTSMRTQDDLHEHTSSFYAELKRLKVIIEAVEASTDPRSGRMPVFFLLDEILKGTNSVDRHTGARALIRQLIAARGAGLIATHDLELGRLEADAGGAIENQCMEVEIKNGALFFDYRLKKGVSQSFNATLLMQQMGIRVDPSNTNR